MASDEMTQLVDRLINRAWDVGAAVATGNRTGDGGARAEAEATLLAAITELEAQRDQLQQAEQVITDLDTYLTAYTAHQLPSALAGQRIGAWATIIDLYRDPDTVAAKCETFINDMRTRHPEYFADLP